MKFAIAIIALGITTIVFNYINISLIAGLILSTVLYYIIYYGLKRWLEL